MTKDIPRRVETQQGYTSRDYEVLESHTDINHASKREAELQLSYGYKVDRESYVKLMDKLNKSRIKSKTMETNPTEQTVTFACPFKKLKEELKKNIGREITYNDGKVLLTKDSIKFIVKHAKKSMYNEDRSYIYNRVLTNYVQSW